MDLPIEQLEGYLITKSVKSGKKQLDDRDLLLIKTLKSLGIAKVGAAVLEAIDKDDYNGAADAARILVFDTTKNFIVASSGISDGPLSELLGMALEAATSKDYDKLRAFVTSARKTDPELADAIERFLKGQIDSLAILAARRAGADPKLMDIAEGVAKGNVEATLKATSTYAGLTGEQTNLVTAAWRTINTRSLDRESVKAIAEFVSKNDPDWKTAKEDINNGYTLASNAVTLVQAITSYNPKYDAPKTIQQYQEIANQKSKDAQAFVATTIGAATTILASALALGLSIAGASSAAGPIGAVVGIIALVIIVGMSFLLDIFFKQGNNDDDIAFAKDQANKLVTVGAIVPSIETIQKEWGTAATTARRMGEFYEGIVNYGRRIEIPTKSGEMVGHLPNRYRALQVRLDEMNEACREIWPFMIDYTASDDISSLAIACAVDGFGGPFASPYLTMHNVSLLIKLVATRYSVPTQALSLALADYFNSPIYDSEAAAKRAYDMDSTIDFARFKVSRKVKLSSGGETTVDTQRIYPSQPPTVDSVQTDWLVGLRGTSAPLQPSVGTVYKGGCTKENGRDYCTPTVEYKSDGIYNDGIKVSVHKNRFPVSVATFGYETVMAERPPSRGTFQSMGAMFASPWVWGELTRILTVMAKTYIQVVGPNIGPFGTRQQIGTQVTLFMDRNPKATFETAVAGSIKASAKEIPALIVQLAEAGLDAFNPMIYGRQINALVAAGRAKTKVDAMVLMDRSTGKSVPDKTSPQYATWLGERSALYARSGRTLTVTKPDVINTW